MGQLDKGEPGARMDSEVSKPLISDSTSGLMYHTTLVGTIRIVTRGKQRAVRRFSPVWRAWGILNPAPGQAEKDRDSPRGSHARE
jgi:hypothetical protein